MMAWRVPPALRAAVALRCQISSGQTLGRLSAINSRSPYLPHAREYATILDDSNRLWDQNGRDTPSPSAPEAHRGEESTYRSGEPAAASQQPAEHVEKQKLLKSLQKHVSWQPRGKLRNRLMESVKQAAASSDPVPELRRILEAYSSKKSTSQGKGARVDHAASKAGSTSKTKKGPTILDVQHIGDTMPLPTKDVYLDAPLDLFNPVKASSAIHNACGAQHISLQVDINFEPKRIGGGNSVECSVCKLKVDIPGVYKSDATGEGYNKQSAKQAAWLHFLSKMHVDGALKELFPNAEELLSAEGSQDSTLMLADLDRKTQKDERDAKTDIFNYSASLGLIPEFEAKMVAQRGRRARVARKGKQRIKQAWVVTIRQDEIGIHVSAAHKDVETAEIAACLAFKERAEKRKLASGEGSSESSSPGSSILNVDTAKDFFAFFKHRTGGINLEVEHDTIAGRGRNEVNSARLSLDGSLVGKAVIMPTKVQAASLAYLTAAVEITNTRPELLREFEQVMEKGKGKYIRPLRPLDLEVDYETLLTMQRALTTARAAGLSDLRSTLEAEKGETARRRFRPMRRLSSSELDNANAQLADQRAQFEQAPELQELRTKKADLPMRQYTDRVLGLVSENLYSVIVGATGSGKTTQVPQILFEDAVKKAQGASCNIICTQPRRIAATSVAERVAVEFNEPLQQSVGYHVRGSFKAPREPYGLTYCTTGILLERLKHNADEVLDTTSHLIIDEVHERDIFIDFLMIVLKRAIERRKATGKSVPKVVLMSATLDTDLFAQYFSQPDNNGISQPCPMLSVPGRTFPVEDKYLGNILDELRGKYGRAATALIEGDTKSTDYIASEKNFSSKHTSDSSQTISEAAIDWKRNVRSELEGAEVTVAEEKEEALVPVSLAAATIAHLCKTTEDGAILTFLPGEEEILAVKNILLERSPLKVNFGDDSKFKICILHSRVEQGSQSEVFQPSPPGCRKIILSTNIAETSVTVPDVKYVVDSGKLRENRYDQIRRITQLKCVWESKSNSKQRAGRAGRVQDGFYYALFSKERAASFRAIGLPELLRSDLQETCLSIKSQGFEENVASFLAQAIEPPPRPAIDVALNNLVSIGAFTKNEALTALGRVLSKLPVHPTLGKMILLGIIFRCLDPILILGAAAGERSLFIRPLENKGEAQRIHHSYAGDSRSDQIALLEAFRELRMIKDDSGYREFQKRSREDLLHMGAFRAIDQTAREIEQILEQAGLIPHAQNMSRNADYGPAELNRNSRNIELVKCLVLNGVYPNLAVKTSPSNPLLRTSTEPNVMLPATSLNGEVKSGRNKHAVGTLFAYGSLSRSNDGNSLFIRDTTHVTSLMTALFGGHLQMTSITRLEMDDWMPFFIKAADRRYATKMILEFRKALDRVLQDAFQSLSEQNMRGLADDPVRDGFAKKVVEVLKFDKRYHDTYP